MICFEKAQSQDAQYLAGVSQSAFHNDLHYGAAEEGGPPGYDSSVWQRQMMRVAAAYYKILFDNRIIGGFLLFRHGRDLIELGRIFIDPDFQNKGIGEKACRYMHELFPEIKHWRLETPQWNLRNHHFYEKMGYVKVGEIPEGEGPAQFRYEKIVS